MNDTVFRKATAIWLIENTSLTFKQIGDFCNLNSIEIQTIADGKYSISRGMDPIKSGQLTTEEIKRCQNNSNLPLKMINNSDLTKSTFKRKIQSPQNPVIGYILWILKNFPELSSEKISSLIELDQNLVDSIKKRIEMKLPIRAKPQNPVSAGLVTKADLEKHVSNELIIETDLEKHVSDELLTEADLEKHVSDELIIETDLEKHVSDELLTEADLENFVSDELIIETDLEKHVSDELLTEADLEKHVSDELITKIDLENFVSDELIIETDLEKHSS